MERKLEGLDIAVTLIQRCQIHKKRNILKYLAQSYHRIFRLKWAAVWTESE